MMTVRDLRDTDGNRPSKAHLTVVLGTGRGLTLAEVRRQEAEDPAHDKSRDAKPADKPTH